MKRTSPRGFTLVELLVVIGIIALLIGILMPALGRARQQALSVQCASNMRQMGMAAQQYASENKGWLPPSHAVPGNGTVEKFMEYVTGNGNPATVNVSPSA